MLKGTVDLNYMNTNVVYIFFSKHSFIFAQHTLVSYKKKYPNIYSPYTGNKQLPVELFPKGYKG